MCDPSEFGDDVSFTKKRGGEHDAIPSKWVTDHQAANPPRPHSFTVPLPWSKPPITLNPGLRSSSTHVKAAKVRVAKGEALEAIIAAGTPKGIPGIELTLHYRVPDRRRRDADNLAATLKVCQDALVVAGVIHEDSWITVPSATCRIHPPSEQGPALWLEITEIP